MFDGLIQNIENLLAEAGVIFELVASTIGIFLDGFVKGQNINDFLPLSFGIIITSVVAFYIARVVIGASNA